MTSSSAIVTGAASGIGRECAQMLLAAGHSITAIDRDADLIRSALPDRPDVLHTVAADIGDPVQCRSAVASAVQRWGTIDMLLHFAAIWTGNLWDETDPSEWETVLRVNVTGTFFVARAA